MIPTKTIPSSYRLIMSLHVMCKIQIAQKKKYITWLNAETISGLTKKIPQVNNYI